MYRSHAGVEHGGDDAHAAVALGGSDQEGARAGEAETVRAADLLAGLLAHDALSGVVFIEHAHGHETTAMGYGLRPQAASTPAQLVEYGLNAGVEDGTALALQVEAPGEVLRRESSVPVRHETGYVVAGARIMDGVERVRIHHDASAAALGVELGDDLGFLHGERADPRVHGYPPRCLLVLPSISDIIARKGAL